MNYPRVLYICADYWMGSNDVVRIMRIALEDLGAKVLELNFRDYPNLVYAPDQSAYPRVPKQVILRELEPHLKAFKPDVIICAAGGITFFEEEYRDLAERFVTVGITVSDPEAYYEWHGKENIYAHRFKYFFTNSVEAQALYKREHGVDSHIFQMGCYPGFHRPMPVEKDFDVAVVGHGKPDRISVVNELAKHFNVGIWGGFWDGCTVKPFPEVHGKELVRAMNKGRLCISFARTMTNRLAIKCHIFEATACRVPVLCEEFEEMKMYFEYGKDIIGYTSVEDLCGKIEHHLKHYDEALQIARNGYDRCSSEHTYHRRWREMFEFLGKREGKVWKLEKTWAARYRALKLRLGIYE